MQAGGGAGAQLNPLLPYVPQTETKQNTREFDSVHRWNAGVVVGNKAIERGARGQQRQRLLVATETFRLKLPYKEVASVSSLPLKPFG